MISIAPSEFRRRIAEEFDRQGWEYEIGLSRQLLDAAAADSGSDPATIAAAVPDAFFARNRTTLTNLVAAIERAVGGTQIVEPPPRTAASIDNRRYELRIGDGTQVNNSNLNVGSGLQIGVAVDGPRSEVLAGIEALIRAGLAGSWNTAQAEQLSRVVDSRQDVGLDDVRSVATEVVRATHPTQSKVQALLLNIATGGISGALGVGLSSGLAELLHQLPV